MTRRLLAVVALGALSAAGGAGAQERFSDMIAVTEVEVPVRVLVKGKPLAGLTRDDFELSDSGTPQTIIGFEIRESWTDRPQPEASPPVALEADPGSRRLLLLFDFSFSRRERLARALRDLRGSLDRQLDPADRVAVGTYGYVSGLNLLVGFTTDREKLNLALDAVAAMLDAKGKRQREILDRLHDLRFKGLQSADESSTYRTLAHELGSAAALAVLTGPVVYDEAEDEGVVVEEQKSLFGPIKVRVEVDVREPIHTAQDQVTGEPDTGAIRAFGLSLAELAFLLRDVGGRKDVILFSEGFSGGLLASARSLFYLQKALRAMRESGWTLHGVDVKGVPGLGERSFSADSLLYMADATGGDVIENVNDISLAAARVLERTGIVYVLTFQPRDDGDDAEFHPLEVELKDPPKGVQILHRPGYYTRRAPSDREVFEQRIDAATWLLTNLEATELDVGVYAESVTDALGGSRVPVAVEVDGVSLLETGTRRGGTLELQLAVLDADSQVREILSADYTILFGDRSSRETLNRGGVRFTGELGLPPGEYRLRVLVRSRKRGEVFLATFPLSVGPGAENELEPPPPTEERPAAAWVTVEAERRAAYFQ